MNGNPNSIAMMLIIDGLSPGWRALVYEYGFKSVCGCLEDGTSLEDAEDALWMARNARQAAWLATDYISDRSQRAWSK